MAGSNQVVVPGPCRTVVLARPLFFRQITRQFSCRCCGYVFSLVVQELDQRLVEVSHACCSPRNQCVGAPQRRHGRQRLPCRTPTTPNFVPSNPFGRRCRSPKFSTLPSTGNRSTRLITCFYDRLYSRPRNSLVHCQGKRHKTPGSGTSRKICRESGPSKAHGCRNSLGDCGKDRARMGRNGSRFAVAKPCERSDS